MSRGILHWRCAIADTLWPSFAFDKAQKMAQAPFQNRMACASCGTIDLPLPVGIPDGLSETDWAGIRKAHSVDRHRVAPLPGQVGVWQARNPGQAWRAQFDGRGFLVEPDTGGWSYRDTVSATRGMRWAERRR